MKQLLLSILLTTLLIFPSISCATYLVCDPSPEAITQVEIEITHAGETTVVQGTYVVDGTEVQLYNLSNEPNGAYTFRARWATDDNWWSDWSEPLDAVKAGKLKNFRIK